MPAVATIPVNPTIGQRLAALDQGQRLRLALGVVLFVAIGVVGLVMGRQAEWRVLYSNLADKDGGAVIAQLTTLNVPYKHSDGGGAILVPADPHLYTVKAGDSLGSIATKYGTTINAIRELEKHGVRAAVLAAIEAARDRGRELGAG